MAAFAETAHVTIADSREAGVSRRFLTTLLAATLLPLPVIALLTQPFGGARPAQDAFHILFLVSVAHGGLSGLFWLDGRYRRHMTAHPRAYYVDAALIAVLAMSGVILLGPRFFGIFTIIYTVWTVVHFARQNWGVLCLAGMASGTGRPGRLASRACVLGCSGGAIGVLPGPALEMLPDGTLALGLALTILGLCAAMIAAFRQVAAGASWANAAMTVSVGLFFLPVYLFGRETGFVTIGLAHAAQYAVIMGVLAADGRQGPPWLRVGGMLGIAGAYLGLFLLLNDPEIWGAWLQPAQVLLNCVVMWHFMLDAGLWWLSQAFQRGAVRESFPFLFAGRPPG